MMARELKLITGLVELDRTSLRERALEMLRTAVTSREIEPGSRLVETELSAAHGDLAGDAAGGAAAAGVRGPDRGGRAGPADGPDADRRGARGHVHRPRRPGGTGRRHHQYPARP